MTEEESRSVGYVVRTIVTTDVVGDENRTDYILTKEDGGPGAVYNSTNEIAARCVALLMHRGGNERYTFESVSVTYDASNPNIISEEIRKALLSCSSRLVLKREEVIIIRGSGDFGLLERIRDSALPILKKNLVKEGLTQFY